ncbi:MAG: hypothetical protein ACTICC_10640 [Lactiplantibacillus plantarum]
MATKKKMTAEQKLDSEIAKYKKAVTSYRNKYNNAKTKQASFVKKANDAKDDKTKQFMTTIANSWKRAKDGYKAGYDRNNTKLQSLTKKKTKFDKEKVKRNLAKVSADIAEHGKKVDAGENEGKIAVYRTDGQSTDVVYLATTGGESDDTTSDISTWARDEGAPAHNYARVSGKNVTTSGIITGATDHESREKFNKLLQWHSRHYELTYKGKIYYKHLMISDIGRTYDDYDTNIKFNLTMQFSYPVKVTTEAGTKKTNKTTKSTKTVQGNRNKTYKSLTVKRGMTYWQLSKTYGKSVAWLEKVNGKSLIAGKKIRVR